MEKEDIKKEINSKIIEFFKQRQENFIPGKTPILTGQAIYDDSEINAIINSLLKGWFGLGEKGEEFEIKFAEYMGSKYCNLVNSGSSANLLALNALKIKRGLKSGEIITPVCTFPTTFNPIIQLGFTPSVVDVDNTLNASIESISSAINKNTKGIMIPHTLGNPAQISEIKNMADENNLFLIEDSCDALGSKYLNKLCGSFGDSATHSFYPAHTITLGEGGAITSNDYSLNRIIRSLRDWGRDCFCRTDEKNPFGACLKRFDHDVDGIPYDHKYIYSQIGYNMKPIELQAAMGIEQIKKIPQFIEKRKENFKIYSEEFSVFDKFIELPEINKNASPVFFGMPIIIKNEKIKRQDFLKFLNNNKIGTKLLFGGNLLRQPAYKDISYSKQSDLINTDRLMRNCFWIGIHPGINEEMIKYIVCKFKEYFSSI